MACAFALDEATKYRGTRLMDIVDVPFLHVHLRTARKHRAAAKRYINALHTALHDRASLGVHNADLWSAITRSADSLALSRWLNTETLTRVDIAPARETVQLLLSELADLIGLLHELAWPDEMSSDR